MATKQNTLKLIQELNKLLNIQTETLTADMIKSMTISELIQTYGANNLALSKFLDCKLALHKLEMEELFVSRFEQLESEIERLKNDLADNVSVGRISLQGDGNTINTSVNSNQNGVSESEDVTLNLEDEEDFLRELGRRLHKKLHELAKDGKDISDQKLREIIRVVLEAYMARNN